MVAVVHTPAREGALVYTVLCSIALDLVHPNWTPSTTECGTRAHSNGHCIPQHPVVSRAGICHYTYHIHTHSHVHTHRETCTQMHMKMVHTHSHTCTGRNTHTHIHTNHVHTCTRTSEHYYTQLSLLTRIAYETWEGKLDHGQSPRHHSWLR